MNGPGKDTLQIFRPGSNIFQKMFKSGVTFFYFDHSLYKASKMQDQKIIELIRSGKNDQALLALYKNFPAVKKMIRLNGGSTADAEDIFQEALIVLCRKIKESGFVLSAQLSTYLFSVCRFLWKDELKKRKIQLVND